MTTRHYMIGGHTVAVSASADIFALMANYEPFITIDHAEPLLWLMVDEAIETPRGFIEEFRQKDEEQEIVCGCSTDGPAFGFFCWQQLAGWLVCTADYRKAKLYITKNSRKLALDNALMILYSLATAHLGTLLFHASAVAYKGYGYLFLGPSGTGKSTHAGLWQRHIDGATLINDDNPVVRIATDGTAMVYGSPWSGKTHCYRNECIPLGGIVSLSQAPHNSIRRIQGIQAYAELLPCISGKRWNRVIADGLHQSENVLASSCPIWHLECLPDREAALLCKSTISR